MVGSANYCGGIPLMYARFDARQSHGPDSHSPLIIDRRSLTSGVARPCLYVIKGKTYSDLRKD